MNNCTNPACVDPETNTHRPMKRYIPLTPDEFIALHGQDEFDAACAYWPVHGIYENEPEVWLAEFSRWTRDHPELLLDFAPEYAHGFLTKRVLPACAGGWIRHLTAPPGLESWLAETNAKRLQDGCESFPKDPDIQIRTDQGYQLPPTGNPDNWLLDDRGFGPCSEEKVFLIDPATGELPWDEKGQRFQHSKTVNIPYKGKPVSTGTPPRIAHTNLANLKPGHGPESGIIHTELPINTKAFDGQFKVSWKHDHDDLDGDVEWLDLTRWHPPLVTEPYTVTYNLLHEHARAHHNGFAYNNDGTVRLNPDGTIHLKNHKSGEHRHSFLLLLGNMENHLNRHTEPEFVSLSDRSLDFDHWAPFDHHGQEPYEVHMSGDPAKYVFLPARKSQGEPYYHSHSPCPAQLMLQEQRDWIARYRMMVRKNEAGDFASRKEAVLAAEGVEGASIVLYYPEKEALLKRCKSHQKPHLDPITQILSPGFRCSGSRGEDWLEAHRDTSHRFGTRPCGEPIPLIEKCNMPTVRRVRNKETGEMEDIPGICRRYVTPDATDEDGNVVPGSCPVKMKVDDPDTGKKVSVPHGTKHSGSTRPCQVNWPCRTHTPEPIGQYDSLRFDWEGMKGEPSYLPGSYVTGEIDGEPWSLYLQPSHLLVHDHKGKPFVDKKKYPNPAERVHCPLLTYDQFLGTNGQKKAQVVYLVAEGGHKAGAVARHIWKWGLDATVISVASVTLWAGVPELDEIIKLLKDRIVVIVGDNDGFNGTNAMVIAQLEGLRQKLIQGGAREVILTSPQYTGYSKLGVDDWCGSLFPDTGGLETMLVYPRIVPKAQITADLTAAFLASDSEAANSRKSDSIMKNLIAMALTLSAMAGRPEIVGKKCKGKCRVYDKNGEVVLDEDGKPVPFIAEPVGHHPTGYPTAIVSPPYSALQSVLGIDTATTIDTHLQGLMDLNWMVEVPNNDPRFQFNSQTGEMEAERTRYFEILDPKHCPTDCSDCDTSEWYLGEVLGDVWYESGDQ